MLSWERTLKPWPPSRPSISSPGRLPVLRAAAHAYAEHPKWDQLPAFIGPDNGAPPELPAEFIRRFVRPRLIAENTLRHGALISTGGKWD